MEQQQKNQNPIVFAWKQSIPVMLGYIFLGIAFGLLLQNGGYMLFWWSFWSVW